MRQSNGRIGLVDMLTTGTGSTKGIGSDISGVDIDIFDLIDFGENGHCCC